MVREARRIIIHELANKVSALKSVVEADPERFERDIILTVDSIDLLLKYLLDTELLERFREGEMKEVSLRGILEDTLSELGLLADLKKVKVQLEDCDLKLTTNEFLLRRIVYNLLHNAVKFSPREGEVKVECESKDGEVCIRIVNEVSENKERLKGTGFGMNLTKELAGWLGAQLEVRNGGRVFETLLRIPRN